MHFLATRNPHVRYVLPRSTLTRTARYNELSPSFWFADYLLYVIRALWSWGHVDVHYRQRCSGARQRIPFLLTKSYVEGGMLLLLPSGSGTKISKRGFSNASNKCYAAGVTLCAPGRSDKLFNFHVSDLYCGKTAVGRRLNLGTLGLTRG